MTTDSPQTVIQCGPEANKISLDAVREMIAECLDWPLEQVVPEARFFKDMPGESVELLDLSFRCERAFQIRSPFKAFQNRDLWDIDASGQLTPAARALMQEKFGYLDIERRIAKAGSINPQEILTIEMIYLMLQHAERSVS